MDTAKEVAEVMVSIVVSVKEKLACDDGGLQPLRTLYILG